MANDHSDGSREQTALDGIGEILNDTAAAQVTHTVAMMAATLIAGPSLGRLTPPDLDAAAEIAWRLFGAVNRRAHRRAAIVHTTKPEST